jgi:hypothetical protein
MRGTSSTEAVGFNRFPLDTAMESQQAAMFEKGRLAYLYPSIP